MKRKKKLVAIRREQFIEAAMKLFAKHGYAETSYQNIADKCGVTQSAVVHHFPKKLDLFREIVFRVVAHNHGIVSAGFSLEDGARTRLEKHFQANLRWALEFRDEVRVIVLLYYFASLHAEFGELYGKILTQARHRIAEYLAAGIREKVFRADTDVRQAAELLHDALLGGIVNLSAMPEGQIPPEKQKVQLWTSLIDSLCA